MVPAKCSHCGSSDIAQRVRLGQTAEAGRVGLSFKTAFILTGTEPLLADLCQKCGTVVRLSVAKPQRKWIQG